MNSLLIRVHRVIRGLGAALLLTLPSFAGCSGEPWTLTGRPIAGHVIDAETGEPLAGAHVIYLWQAISVRGNWKLGGIGGHGNPEICYHAAAASTDAQGRFRIPAWEKPQTYGMPNAEPIGYAYAKGHVPGHYLAWSGSIKQGTLFDHPDDVFRLVPSQAKGDRRLDELWGFIRRGCSYGGDSQRALVPALTAAYDEARTAALTPEQTKRTYGFAEMIAWAAVAPDMNGSHSEPQIRQYISDHLPEALPPAPKRTMVIKPAPAAKQAQPAVESGN